MLPFLSLNHIFHPPKLLFRERVQAKRNFLWVALYVSLPLCHCMTNHQWQSWESTLPHTIVILDIAMHTLCNTDKTSRKSGNHNIPFPVHFPTVGNVKTGRAASTVPWPGQGLHIWSLANHSAGLHDLSDEGCFAKLDIVIPSKDTPDRHSLLLPPWGD